MADWIDQKADDESGDSTSGGSAGGIGQYESFENFIFRLAEKGLIELDLFRWLVDRGGFDGIKIGQLQKKLVKLKLSQEALRDLLKLKEKREKREKSPQEIFEEKERKKLKHKQFWKERNVAERAGADRRFGKDVSADNILSGELFARDDTNAVLGNVNNQMGKPKLGATAASVLMGQLTEILGMVVDDVQSGNVHKKMKVEDEIVKTENALESEIEEEAELEHEAEVQPVTPTPRPR